MLSVDTYTIIENLLWSSNQARGKNTSSIPLTKNINVISQNEYVSTYNYNIESNNVSTYNYSIESKKSCFSNYPFRSPWMLYTVFPNAPLLASPSLPFPFEVFPPSTPCSCKHIQFLRLRYLEIICWYYNIKPQLEWLKTKIKWKQMEQMMPYLRPSIMFNSSKWTAPS